MQDEQGADQGPRRHRGHRDQQARDPRAGRAGQRAVRRDARDRQRQHGGGQVGTASLRAVPFCTPMAAASTTMSAYRRPVGTGGAVSAAMITAAASRTAWTPAATPSAARGCWSADGRGARNQRADRETGDRDDRGKRGEPRRSGQREGQEDHVAGHVGHKDVTEE